MKKLFLMTCMLLFATTMTINAQERVAVNDPPTISEYVGDLVQKCSNVEQSIVQEVSVTYDYIIDNTTNVLLNNVAMIVDDDIGYLQDSYNNVTNNILLTIDDLNRHYSINNIPITNQIGDFGSINKLLLWKQIQKIE